MGTVEEQRMLLRNVSWETYERPIALLADVVAEELDLDVENVGSTTFKREDLQRGFEADESLYFLDNAARARGILRERVTSCSTREIHRQTSS